MRRSLLSLPLLCMALSLGAQPRTDTLLERLLRSQASPLLQHILQYPDSFHYQLIYTQIDRDSRNRPHFHHYYLHVDANDYFNPASTVKMPIAFLALEKLHRLNVPGLDMNTPMLTDSARPGQVTVHTDSTSANGLPSIAHYIKKVFLVSDNDAYNRLYEFIGQQAIHERLWAMGYPHIRIVRRFMPLDDEGNRYTNPIRFVQQGRLVYAQPEAHSDLAYDFSRQVLVGQAHFDRNDKLVPEPMDFTRHNNAPLEDLQRLLQSVLFPESVPERQRFHLSEEDYRFLYRYMSEYPSESRYPQYDTAEYFNSYTKFFMFKAGRGSIPPYIRVFNKTGWSYGYLTDIAYIVDLEHKVEFMLSGTIYVNRDGVLNDNRYEYEETGYPFFKEAGNIIYRYELQRARKHTPDLSRFVLEYK